ncbi:hypothetical protein [Spirosoma foliorum]|uniref:Uncharacterized protein n=1 Tax=Spirosoma foliorum TaxID=2710596 RepID=A0A7G5H4N0_9BACT|nr:hypothetical protein [Spirosoma foliorum]QMW06072.1 hypothetical protein H3H32_14825 [Spirosoma foliorum]
MKNYAVFASLVSLTLTSSLLYGQAKIATEPFPTYQQIKRSDSEIIDYVSKDGQSEFAYNYTIKVFDNPDSTVIYILNGKPTLNGKYAKEVVNKSGNHITNMVIERPTENRKQVIRIDYTTKQ